MADLVNEGRSQEKRAAGLKIGVFFLWALFVSFMVPLVPGLHFFVGHIVFLVFLFVYSFREGVDYKVFVIGASVLLLLAGISILQIIFFEVGVRFFNDNVKFFFLLSLIVICLSMKSIYPIYRLIKHLVAIFPLIFLSYLIVVFDGSAFSYSGRFYVPYFASPNVLGVLCSLCIIYLWFFRSSYPVLLFYLLFFFYFCVLLLGFSRAAIIALFLSVAIAYGVRGLFGAFLLMVLGMTCFLFLGYLDFLPNSIIEKANVIEDVRETGGSNRIGIWIDSISSQLGSLPELLIGGGPGRVIKILEYGGVVNHPHNFFIFLFWSYGIVFFMVFIVLWILFFIVVLNRNAGGEKRFLVSLFWFYSLIFMMDTHVLASQYIVFHSIFLSILIGVGVLRIPGYDETKNGGQYGS